MVEIILIAIVAVATYVLLTLFDVFKHKQHNKTLRAAELEIMNQKRKIRWLEVDLRAAENTARRALEKLKVLEDSKIGTASTSQYVAPHVAKTAVVSKDIHMVVLSKHRQ